MTARPIKSFPAPPAVLMMMAFLVPLVSAQLAPNQTNGFGNGRIVTFTYLQNFDCVDVRRVYAGERAIGARPKGKPVEDIERRSGRRAVAGGASDL